MSILLLEKVQTTRPSVHIQKKDVKQGLKSKKLPRSSIFHQRLTVKVLSDSALQTGLQSWPFDKLFTVCSGYLQGVPRAEPLSC